MESRPVARHIQMRGRDYTVLGRLAAAELPGAGGIALSRGAEPKAYAHTDPNEDGALVLDSDAGTLITVVDGHHGTRASELALQAVTEAWIELLRDDDAAFRSAVQAVVARVCDQLSGSRGSGTCLMLATLIGGRCRWACFGDASLIRGDRSAPVCEPNPLMLKPSLRIPPDSATWSGGFALLPGERIAAVTDGVTNFVPDLDDVRAILHETTGDLESARDVARAALEGGAGDNVAVATCAVRVGPTPLEASAPSS